MAKDQRRHPLRQRHDIDRKNGRGANGRLVDLKGGRELEIAFGAILLQHRRAGFMAVMAWHLVCAMEAKHRSANLSGKEQQ
jgi:hypothetical protein